MIILNKKKFAKNDDEFVGSLFDGVSTCVGYYRVNKKSISLLDMKKNKIGVICNNVLASARKLENGRFFYSYMNPKIVGDYDFNKMMEDVGVVMKLLK